jgi:hypothetical protein
MKKVMRLNFLDEEVNVVGGSAGKPPLGLRPWWIAGEAREREISAAIFRYWMAHKKAPWGWRLERRLWRLLLHWAPPGMG